VLGDSPEINGTKSTLIALSNWSEGSPRFLESSLARKYRRTADALGQLARICTARGKYWEAEQLEWANEILMIDSYQSNSYSMPRDLRWQKAVVLYMKGDEQAARSVAQQTAAFPP
jgi:hypothetical protein